MRKRIVLSCVVAGAAVALLVPAASAQAAWRTDAFCSNVILPASSNSFSPRGR